MAMRDINISTIIGSPLPVEQQLPLIKAAGFDGFFTSYSGFEDEPIELWAEAAARLNLKFETVHAPFEHANRMWEGGDIGEEYLFYLQHSIIDACYKVGVKKCIMHATVGNTAPEISREGLELFIKLCTYAKIKDVQIAFENLEPLPHFDAVMEYISDPFHGFCWDCGHNACYTPQVDMMKKYGHRLKCIHVHDNFGVTRPGNVDYRDDRHFLPMDGIIDWDWFTNTLRQYNYDGPLTLEVSIEGKSEYREMTVESYLTEAYKRAATLALKI